MAARASTGDALAFRLRPNTHGSAGAREQRTGHGRQRYAFGHHAESTEPEHGAEMVLRREGEFVAGWE